MMGNEYEVTMKVTYPDRSSVTTMVPVYRSVVIDNAEDASAAARRALVALNERLVGVEWKADGSHEVSVTEVRGVRTVNGAVVEYLSLHQPDAVGFAAKREGGLWHRGERHPQGGFVVPKEVK